MRRVVWWFLWWIWDSGRPRRCQEVVVGFTELGGGKAKISKGKPKPNPEPGPKPRVRIDVALKVTRDSSEYALIGALG